MNYAGWSGSAAIAARTQQLADEVEGGDEAAADTPATDEATTVADAAWPIKMTVTSQPYATSTTVTQAQVVPTVQEEINRLEGLVTSTENKQLDEEGSMKTFKEQQLDKIEELKDKNTRLKRRSLSLSSCYSILFACSMFLPLRNTTATHFSPPASPSADCILSFFASSTTVSLEHVELV